jgi:hypothetical protein
MKDSARLTYCVSKRDKEALRRAASLVPDDSREILTNAEATREERIRAAQQQCAERRRRREDALAANKENH